MPALLTLDLDGRKGVSSWESLATPSSDRRHLTSNSSFLLKVLWDRAQDGPLHVLSAHAGPWEILKQTLP